MPCAPDILDLKGPCSFLSGMLCPSSPAASRLSWVPPPVWSSWAYLHHSGLSHYTHRWFTCPSHTWFCVFSSLHPQSITECLAHTGSTINVCSMSQWKNVWPWTRLVGGEGWVWGVGTVVHEQQECSWQLGIKTHKLLDLRCGQGAMLSSDMGFKYLWISLSTLNRKCKTVHSSPP